MEGADLQLHAFWSSALDGGELAASRSDYFTPDCMLRRK